MSKNKKGPIVVLLVVVIVGILLNIRYRFNVRQIKKDHVITTAKIYKVVDVGSKYPGVRLYYTYEILTDTFFSDERYINMDKGNENKFIDKVFPVAYSKSNPEKCKLLISEEDFELFDITFPDSMYWTVDYIN